MKHLHYHFSHHSTTAIVNTRTYREHVPDRRHFYKSPSLLFRQLHKIHSSLCYFVLTQTNKQTNEKSKRKTNKWTKMSKHYPQRNLRTALEIEQATESSTTPICTALLGDGHGQVPSSGRAHDAAIPSSLLVAAKGRNGCQKSAGLFVYFAGGDRVTRDCGVTTRYVQQALRSRSCNI